MYSFVVYLYVNGSGSITSVAEERANLSAVVTCNYVVSVWRGFLFLWVLGMGYVHPEPSIKLFPISRLICIKC